MPTEARESARRIVVDVFGPGEQPPVGPAPAPTPTAEEHRATGPASAAERRDPPGERPASAAERRARELVSEVFDPPAPEPEPPRPPTPAELAGRRIAAEAEAAQRARAEERVAAAAAARRAAREAAEEQERERVRRVREEWAARAQAEQEAEREAEQAAEQAAEQERRRAAAVAQQERERAEQRQRESTAARAAGESPAPSAAVDELAAASATSPATTGEEPLFGDAAGPTVAPGDDDGLFEPELAGLPASLSEDVAGPPAPPADQLPLRLAEAPPAPQLAARMVSDVLENRSGHDEQAATVVGPATPMTVEEVDHPRRVARWLVVTVLAAVGLAVLFPLAVRAMLQLVSLS